MKKEISKVVINGKSIGFERAMLYVGRDGGNRGITYILSLFGHIGIQDYEQSVRIEILTKEGEARTIVGTMGHSNSKETKFYIVGEPFPVTPDEMRLLM